MAEIKVSNGSTKSNNYRNILKETPVDNSPFSRIFRVEVVDTKTFNDKIFVGFVHKDHVDANNISSMTSTDAVTPFYALLCTGIPKPTPGSQGLVASIFGNKVGDDFFYIQTYFEARKPIEAPTPKAGTFSQITKGGSIVISGNKKLSAISAGKNKVEVTDNKVNIGENGYGLDVSGRELSFKNAKGETRLSVGEDGVIISSEGDIKFISKNGNIELIGGKVINKNPADLLEPPSEALPNEDNSSNFSKNVSGSIEFGGSAYTLSLTDTSLITGNPFSGDTYSVQIMRGDAHYKIANGDFLVSLLDGGITDKKFQVLVGKLSFIKKAEFSLDSNGFTIASGQPTLKLSRYIMDFNDGGFGPLSYPKWQIGYRGVIQMKIGIMAEAPTFGKSKMELIADEILLGRIYIKGLDGGRVVTTLTDPVVDYITGIMHIGSFSVFAIS
jgi:hypothetical protein